MEAFYNINVHKGEVGKWTKGVFFDLYDEYLSNKSIKQGI